MENKSKEKLGYISRPKRPMTNSRALFHRKIKYRGSSELIVDTYKENECDVRTRNPRGLRGEVGKLRSCNQHG